MNDQGVRYALVNNLKKACKYFRKAAEKGHKGALLNLTHALFELSKTDKSNESKLFGELLRWITKAANDGIPEAQYNFAYVFYQKSGGENPEELETVITLLKKAAQQDYAPATYILGIFYITGRGAKKDILGGVTLLKRAAAGGHEPAIAALKTLDLEAELKKLKSKKLNKTQQNKDKK
jgi:TPR repeat protein